MKPGNTAWLIDKSAFALLHASPDAGRWIERVNRGLIRISTVTRLEIGYSARTAADVRADLTRPPLSLLPIEYLRPAIEDRAVQIQAQLADHGQHRAPSIPDLLIAATAELNGLAVLHVDKDFDLIAAITGQSVERLRL